MKKIILVILFITSINPNLWSQEGITLTEGNKAYYKLTVSGNRSYSDGPWFFGTTICDRGIKEIRFLDKNNNRVKTVDTNGKTGVFSYNTSDHEFTKDQFPIQIHIDSDFVDRLLCKGFAIYDFPQSWYTDDFKNRGMDVIKVEYNRACYSQGYTGFWSPDGRNYGDIFYYHAAYVYMRDLEVKSDPIVEIQLPSEPIYLASEEFITVGIPDNLLDGYAYNWKYKIGSDRNYRYISNRYVTLKNGQKVLRIKGEDFLPPSAYGKRIRLELDTGCVSSNPISFTYYPSAPRFVKVEKVDPVCYEGGGKVKVFFERNLNRDRLSTIVRDPKDPVVLVDPSQVVFDVTIKDSSCNDGDGSSLNNNDGEISIVAEGGRPGIFEYAIRLQGDITPLHWVEFENVNMHTLLKLRPDAYTIQVRKKVGEVYCTGYSKDDTSNPIITEIITQPDRALSVEAVFYKEPTAFGFTDGVLKYLVTGGTPLDDGSYTFEWKNAEGSTLNSTHTEVLPDTEGYVITLHSLGADMYTLQVTDKNFNEATYKTGCFVQNIKINLIQPDPIKVVFEVLNPISCHIDNEYSNGVDLNVPFDLYDQFQDGSLTAHVTGGVVYDTEIVGPANNIPQNDQGRRLPYYYHWKKKINNVWTDIAINDSIINDQSYGDYALNVTDKNGIVLGSYMPITTSVNGLEYLLTTPIDSTYYLKQPEKLGISFEKTVISCFSGADATATALVTGGTPPYRYYWSTGSNMAIATNLTAGRHAVYVVDSNECVIEGTITIEQPNGLKINPISVEAPTCHQGNDGHIQVTVSGGVPPYTYTWSTGSTSSEIKDLVADTYILEITDSEGCKTFYEETLIDPPLVQIDLGKKRFLCDDQSLELDIRIDDPNASYQWSSDNGFASAKGIVTINTSGIYTATITNGLGCSNQDIIEVVVFDTPIDAHYLIASQAYVDQEVTLINVSDPIGEKIEWSVPEQARIIEESADEITVVFDAEGAYDINLRSHMGDCFEDFTKTIVVQQRIERIKPSDTDSFLKEFILFPNPNSGTFQTKISLEDASDILVKIINLSTGAVLNEKTFQNNTEFLLDYSISLPSGVYLVLLETSRGGSRRKLVVE